MGTLFCADSPAWLSKYGTNAGFGEGEQFGPLPSDVMEAIAESVKSAGIAMS